MATFDSNGTQNVSAGQKPTAVSSGRYSHSPIGNGSVRRAQTLADLSTYPASLKHRRNSNMTADSQTERISMKSTMDDLLLPTTPTKEHEYASSHFHSTPLLFAVLPALGGIMFEGGSTILTDICLIALSCIFLNWSLRLPWDWYHSSQSINTDLEYAHPEFKDEEKIIIEEDEDENVADSDHNDEKPSNQPSEPREKHGLDSKQTRPEHDAATGELNRYQLVALFFCFAGPMLSAWLLHSIREQLSRPSEGLISNFNLGIFVLAAELRPTQHVFKLIQSRILYLQRVVARNPYAARELDPAAMEDMRNRLSELEAHIINGVQEPSSAEFQATTFSQAVVELRKTIQPELDALNRAVRRYEKRAIALELQVRSELQDHDQRIKDALALAAAVTRQKKGSLATILDFFVAIVLWPVQATLAMFSAVMEMPKWIFNSAYETLEGATGGRPAWLFPKRVVLLKRKERDSNARRKRRD